MELKRGIPMQEYTRLINLVTMHTTINNAGSRSRSEPASDLRGPECGSEGGGGDIVKSSASSQSHSMGADRAHPLAGAELWDGGELRSAADLPGSAAARVDNTQAGSSVYAMHKELLQIRELEGYEMIRLLGHGTHAECYLMKETASNTEWAVKVLWIGAVRAQSSRFVVACSAGPSADQNRLIRTEAYGCRKAGLLDPPVRCLSES